MMKFEEDFFIAKLGQSFNYGYWFGFITGLGLGVGVMLIIAGFIIES